MANEIKGAAEFERKLKDWKSGILKTVSVGLTEWGERTIAVSVDGGEGYSGNIVPVGKTGRLMNSKMVDKPKKQGEKVSIIIGYGTEYAAAVHELGEANFTRPGSGGQYLRDPAKYMGDKAREIIGPHISDFLK